MAQKSEGPRFPVLNMPLKEVVPNAHPWVQKWGNIPVVEHLDSASSTSTSQWSWSCRQEHPLIDLGAPTYNQDPLYQDPLQSTPTISRPTYISRCTQLCVQIFPLTNAPFSPKAKVIHRHYNKISICSAILLIILWSYGHTHSSLCVCKGKNETTL